jgi:hypothetical protein
MQHSTRCSTALAMLPTAGNGVPEFSVVASILLILLDPFALTSNIPLRHIYCV